MRKTLPVLLLLAACAPARTYRMDAVSDTTPQLSVHKVEVAGGQTTVTFQYEAGEQPRTLPLTEIRARDGYFDFDAKYSETKGAEEICPADLHGPAAERMRAWSIAIHEAFCLRGMSRTDFILPAEGDPVYLETNSIPGLTERSLLPQACKAADIGFGELITLLIDSAEP